MKAKQLLAIILLLVMIVIGGWLLLHFVNGHDQIPSFTQAAPAGYTVLNGGKHEVELIVTTWMEQDGDIPAGYCTKGYYKIDPGDFFTISWGSSDYYIRMEKLIYGFSKLIKPDDSKTRSTYAFWVEPKNAFTIVEKADGEILHGSGGMENLTQTGGFYKYGNKGIFRINGENLEAAKLKKINSELTEKARDLAEINQQLTRLNLSGTEVRPVGHTVLNGSTKKVFLIVSTWLGSTEDFPAGYRTYGYYKIDPGNFFTINWGSFDYYIRMYKWVNGNRKPIKPSNSKTRGPYTFYVDSKNAFTVVEKADQTILYSSGGMENLTQTGDFYKYGNKGTFRIGGPHQELAEKALELAKIDRELLVRKFQLVRHEGQFNEIRDREVHALLILLGNDENIRSSVEQNASKMRSLLRQISQHTKVHLTVMTSDDELTGKVTTMELLSGHTTVTSNRYQGLIRGHQVNNWLNNLHSGQHDTILIYYNGHGEIRGSDDTHVFNFDQQTGDEVLRSDLRVRLDRKPGRLKMLITDTCSNRAGLPELVAKTFPNYATPRQRSTTYIKNLFLQHQGILDITAVKPGHYAWGSTDIGGYFTIGLLQSFTIEADTNGDRFLTWEEAFKTAQLKTNEFFKQANFQPIDKLKMNGTGQKTQTPVGHSFPARAD